MKKVVIHTDGACEGNPGPGGWAAILRHGAHAKELCGAEPATTNNRMELTAAIAALRALKEPCEAELFTDSEYLRKPHKRIRDCSRSEEVWALSLPQVTCRPRASRDD